MCHALAFVKVDNHKSAGQRAVCQPLPGLPGVTRWVRVVELRKSVARLAALRMEAWHGCSHLRTTSQMRQLDLGAAIRSCWIRQAIEAL